MFVVFQSARFRAAGIGKDFKENPNLRDNWTDAEGYYRMYILFRGSFTQVAFFIWKPETVDITLQFQRQIVFLSCTVQYGQAYKE